MPIELQHENKIKAVLDQRLVNLRTNNTDPRAPSYDMAGSRSTYSFEKVGNSRKRDCLAYENWKKKNRKTGNMNRKPISCYNFGKEGHISCDCKSERQNSRQRDEQQNGGEKLAEMAKQTADMVEMIKKITTAPDAGFQIRVSTMESWQP